MDLICRSAFGIQIGDMMDPNNTFVKLFKDLQGADAEFNFTYTLSSMRNQILIKLTLIVNYNKV